MEKSSLKSKFPNLGLASTVGVTAMVARGVLVAVGGNQTGVAVGVAEGGSGVLVGSGGRGVETTGWQAARTKKHASNKADRPSGRNA